jgi:DNA-binding transcriptional LysR family regulator
MIDAAAVVHYPEQLQMFRTEHPEVELLLRVSPSAQLLDSLVSGELDLVVCVDPTELLPGIETEPLLSEDLAVYGPPGERIGAPSTWGPWVLFPAGSHTRSIIVERLAQLGAPLDVVAESHQPEVLREMVHLDTGWTVLPTSQGEHGDRPLTGGRPLTTRQLVLATRRGSVHDPVVDELAESLRQAST